MQSWNQVKLADEMTTFRAANKAFRTTPPTKTNMEAEHVSLERRNNHLHTINFGVPCYFAGGVGHSLMEYSLRIFFLTQLSQAASSTSSCWHGDTDPCSLRQIGAQIVYSAGIECIHFSSESSLMKTPAGCHQPTHLLEVDLKTSSREVAMQVPICQALLNTKMASSNK